jgi:hypothetical protein
LFNEQRKIQYLTGLDWALKSASTKYATHGYHPYASRYIPQIPHYLISVFTKKNDLVLDNFLGSGTTLVESKILGRDAIGLDVNPLACLIARVKTTNIQKCDLEEICQFCLSLDKEIQSLKYNDKHNTSILVGNIPHPNILKWFNQSSISELLLLKNRIDSIKKKKTREFLLVAFSSILRTVSDATSGFGNLMLNLQPPPRIGAYQKFCRVVTSMVEGMKQYNQTSTHSNVKILNSDSRNLNFLKDQTIDFICTHPPYMASVPYAEYQRLSLWWLGFDQSALEKKLIGGRRSRKDTPCRFLSDMHLVLVEMKRVLAKRKYCCIVIGNPIYKGKTWHLNEILKKDSLKVGFALIKEIRRRKYRLTMGNIKEEYVLILKNE